MSRRKTYMLAAPYLKPGMLFEDAAKAFLRAMQFKPDTPTSKLPGHQIGFIGWRTLRDYGTTMRALGKHFSTLQLDSITHQHIRQYQELRASGALTDQENRPGNMKRAGVVPDTVNKEVGSLLRILIASGAWTRAMLDSYVPLQSIQTDPNRALTPEEQDRFLKVLASKEKWSTLYWYSILRLATTMSTLETRSLKREDFDLNQRIVRVRSEGAKNRYRIRTIPLNDDATKAAEWLLVHCRTMGSTQPYDYIFPFRVKRGQYDTYRPMTESGVKHQWEDARKAADVPWLRLYDLRHTAITRLAEAGTPIQVIMDMAGHISQKMQQHYTHISQQSKRYAVNMAALVQADAVSKRPNKLKNLARFAIPQPATTGNGDSLSISSLIKRLQRAGLGADMILSILADDEKEQPSIIERAGAAIDSALTGVRRTISTSIVPHKKKSESATMPEPEASEA